MKIRNRIHNKALATLAAILAMATLMSLMAFPGSAENVNSVGSVDASSSWKNTGDIWSSYSSDSDGRALLGTYEDYVTYDNSERDMFFYARTTLRSGITPTSGYASASLCYAEPNQYYYNVFLTVSTSKLDSSGEYYASKIFSPVDAISFPTSNKIGKPAGMVDYSHRVRTNAYPDEKYTYDSVYFTFQNNYANIAFTTEDPMPKPTSN